MYNNNGKYRWEEHSQYPKSLDGMSIWDKELVMQEIQKNREIEEAEEEEFFKKIRRVYNGFLKHGFNQDASLQLTTVFFNDPIFNKKRNKRETITEIINRVKSQNEIFKNRN